MIKSFYDLEVYQGPKKLFAKLTQIVKTFPKEGQYLKTQLLRAGNSIHANIAEGFGRTGAEFKQYLARSLGSNNEVLSHLEDARTARHIDTFVFKELFWGYTVLGNSCLDCEKNGKSFHNPTSNFQLPTSIYM